MNRTLLRPTSRWNYRTYQFLALSGILLLFLIPAKAQYFNVPVTGYNADVVADGATGAGINSTTDDVDGANWIFVSTTFDPGAGICAPGATGLPATNQITSTRTPGLTYTLQPYAGNNSLRLASGTSGTLTLTTPINASNLYLLALGGSGACAINVTITFTDLTTQIVTSSVNDWCSGTNAASGVFYRINRNNTTCTGGGTCQYFYESNLAILPANYNKNIASITISSTGGILNVMGVGAKAPCDAPTAQPTTLTTGTVTTSTIGLSFTAASPLPTGVLVVRYPMGATPTPPVNGTYYAANQTLGLGTIVDTSTTLTAFTASGLSGSASYDFYIYSYNDGTTCGGPIYLTTSPLTGTIATAACSGTMSGTVMIGPGLPNTVSGGYTSLTNAFAHINANGLAGNTILELQTGYDGTSANETFPITFLNNSCLSSTRSLTIRPAAGVGSPLTITSNNTGATLLFDGGDYITIDGRPGGSGTAQNLSIINTNAGGAAIQFSNDARENTITYCDIQGQNTSATTTILAGVIYFGTANSTVLTGNDNNTISFCDIHGTATGTPTIGISSNGSTTNAGSWNDNNTITDCNIYDFFSPTTATTGIKLEGGSNAFSISNNHFYQTVTRNYTSAVAHRVLWLTPVSSNASSPSAFQVINNFIGGNSSSGTGTYTITGTAGVYFWGMDINHWGTAPTSVQGNTLTNISVSSTITSTTNDFFRGISTGNAGNMNIGTITGNTIGSGSVNNAITLATTGTGTNAYGIKVGSTSNSTDTINIYNNTIGGIIDSSNTSTSSAHLYGIALVSGSFTNIINNTIGSTTLANSLNSPNPSTATQTVIGISIPTGLTNHVATITGNTIANLNNGYVGASTGYTRGIAVLSSARTTITNNNINNLYTASTYSGSATLACLMGIIANTSNIMTVTGNTIHTLVLSNPSSTASSYILGIYIGANGNIPTHPINKNFIHSFDIVSTSNDNVTMHGIEIFGGSNIISNNMIRLGIKPDGTDLTNATIIKGIYLNTPTTTNIYHNTVLINGTNVVSTVKNTMAFHRNGTGVHDIRNNIFVNNRSNAVLGSGGKHYQLFLNNLTTVTLNNNVYFGNGNDGQFATPNNGANDSTTYSINWAASGDVGSIMGDPQFIAPTANASTVSLHIHPTNPSAAESAGVLITSITDDIDGDIRATNTPTDAGADAGNFTGINMIIDSTIVSQPTSSVVTGSTYQQILGIKMYTRNAASPLQVASFLLNTASTTSNLDIQNARIYYTGAQSTFDTASAGLFGTLTTIPSGGYTITGSRNLITGINYFWLSYDIQSTATLGNQVDASLDSILFTTTTFPNILAGNPTGARTIKGPLNGTYNVGVGQTYTTLTAVATDLSILGVSGPVIFVLKDALYNTTSGETFPITFGPIDGVSETNTITIVPDASVVSRIEGNHTTAVIDLNGASNIIIDGRPGGTGIFVSGTNLQIANTANGPSVRFINEATKNTIRYADLKSNNNITSGTAGAGVVNFGTTTGINGNDTNRIEYCDIHEEAVGFPLIGISSIGSATTVATNNDGNIIDNCNIYNFFSAGTASVGVYIGANNGGWAITNNHVYQTASRTYTGAVSHRAFWITPNTASLTSASGFVINNNYIGGDAPAGTGTYTMTGSVNYVFYGMDLSLGIGAPSEVQGNTISNMNMTGSNTGSAWYGINIANGNVNCGTTTGNLIGSTTTNGAISYTSNSNGGSVLPYRVGGGAAIMFRHNIASGITLTGASTSTAVSFFGMNLSGGSVVVADSNFIGYPTLPNSISLGVNTSTTASVALGIITNPSAVTTHAIVANHICNITNNYSGASTASSLRALHINPSSTGAFYASGNIIEQITNASTSTGTGANAATHALIVNTSNASSVTISSNIIRSVNSTATTGAVVTNGIYYAGPASGSHLVSRNLISAIEPLDINPSAIAVGIDINSGTVTVANNMIRLGIDSTGAANTTAFTLRGISKNTATSRIYFNTVYVGGTGVGTDFNRTFAFARLGNGIDTVRNNIFVNQRMNGATGAGHFAVSLNNATTLAMDYNLLRADSIGVFNNTPYFTLANWKGGSGIDANTVSSAAVLINPTGGTATMDLHIHPTTPTPIEGAGITDAGLGMNEDFDGEDRTILTPTDIGADAGNFIPNDIAAPSITFTPLTNTQLTTDRTITATISDLTAIYLTGANRPRIYFKKQASGTYVSATGTMVSGNAQSSVWDFTISSTALGGILSNDSVYYYVVAQDSTPANNVGSFPGGVEATDVNTITVHPGTPASYLITPTVAGVYTVGTSVPCNYNSITQALNLLSVSFINGPVILELMDTLYDNTTETFPIVISSSLGFDATNTLTIRPATGVNAVIRDSITHAVLDLNGIDYLTLDGRQGGTGAPYSLTIENRSVSNASYGTAATPNNIANAIRFINDATHNTIQFTNIRGANGTNESGVIFFSTGLVVGNSYNIIDQNNIGDVPGITNPFTIFCGVGSTDALAKYNRNNIISNNNIYNFFAPAGESNGFKISKGNTAWTITGNHFFQTEPLTGTGGTQYLMNLNRRVGPTVSDDAAAAISLDSMVVTYNTIGGSGPNASGAPWSITGAGPNFSGIYGEYGKNSTMRISNNTFTNFEMSQNTSGNRWVGINLFNGLANIDSNVIGSVNGVNAIILTSTVNSTGIIGIATNYSATSTPAGTTRISHNRLGGITLNGNATASVNFTGINIANAGGNSTQTYLIENNTIGNGIADNIITAGASASATTQSMIGINNNTNSANMIVRNNTVQNLTNTYAGTSSGLVHGMSITLGVDTITGNTISNLTNAAAQTSAATSNTVSVVGIMSASSANGHYIGSNIIRNLWNTNTGAVNTGVIGIQANSIGNGEIAGNTIYNLAQSSTSADAYIFGISTNSANNIRLYNNMIALGLDTNNLALTNTPTIFGINKMNTGTLATLHNTVFVQGSNVGSGTGTTAAYARIATGGDSLMNNILVNTRSNTSTGGAHYVMRLNNTSAFVSNHNILQAGSAISGDTLIGITGATGYELLSDWNTFSGLEAGSKDTSVAFVSNTDLHLNASMYGVMTLKGAQVNIARDIDNDMRVSNAPYIGADEIATAPLPVQLVHVSAVAKEKDVLITWLTASEINNKGFYVQRSVDGRTFSNITFVQGTNTSTAARYQALDLNAFTEAAATVLYYRIYQLDMDGKVSVSEVVTVRQEKTQSNTSISIYPNPVTDRCSIQFESLTTENTQLTITDVQGKIVREQTIRVQQGINTINLDGIASLKQGIYFVTISVNGTVSVEKLMKY